MRNICNRFCFIASVLYVPNSIAELILLQVVIDIILNIVLIQIDLDYFVARCNKGLQVVTTSNIIKTHEKHM